MELREALRTLLEVVVPACTLVLSKFYLWLEIWFLARISKGPVLVERELECLACTSVGA
jgi:hypothetical protein